MTKEVCVSFGLGGKGPVNKVVALKPRRSASSLTKLSISSNFGISFTSDASLVLVGIRGTGKTTLAIIASTAMKRRIVETDKIFKQTTGLTSPTYKKTFGAIDHQRRQKEILREILDTYQSNSIIVCGWMERNVQALLKDYARSHPVIHVLRDAKGLQEHIKVWDEDRITELLNVSGPFFRKCCNFEFFNATEDFSGSIHSADALHSKAPRNVNTAAAPYLTLKRAERHFLKFLSLITSKGSIPFIESAFPLASIPVEDRQYTYAVSILLSGLLAKPFDIEDLETGADAIEIVIDDFITMNRPNSAHSEGLSSFRANQISHIYAQIRRSTVIPIIYHVLRPPKLEECELTQSLYLEYVQHGFHLAAEFVSVDLALPDGQIEHTIQCKSRSKVIAHFHSSASLAEPWSNPIWVSLYERAAGLGCDIVRLTRQAQQQEDNFSINIFHHYLETLLEPKLPCIAYNTGRLGRTSVCFNKILSSVKPEDSTSDQIVDVVQPHYSPPCITAKHATIALYSSFVYDPMRLYVFGANVSYSLSPAMHNAAFKSCGIPHHYTPHSTNSINTINNLVHDPQFAGASVGLPFKVEAIALTHSLSPHAKAIGAVNTLIPIRQLNDDRSIPDDALLFKNRSRAGPVKALYGENTDWIGIRACIRRGLSPANAVKPNTSGLVIGAGGMARAAVYAMLQLGVRNIVIFNRTSSNAEKMVNHFKWLLSRHDLPLLTKSLESDTSFRVIESRNDQWPQTLRHPTMVVSCIPTHSIGDSPAPDFTLPPEWLESPTGGIILELAYKTLTTPLLEQGRAEAHKGWITMDGLDLLPEQGFAQFELFTGRRAPRRLMRGEVFRQYTDEQGRSNLAQLQLRLEGIAEQEP
jgi:shikimate 5-dehydrogenase/shikimate kinase/3-dehydroquinate dehydratase